MSIKTAIIILIALSAISLSFLSYVSYTHQNQANIIKKSRQKANKIKNNSSKSQEQAKKEETQEEKELSEGKMLLDKIKRIKSGSVNNDSATTTTTEEQGNTTSSPTQTAQPKPVLTPEEEAKIKKYLLNKLKHISQRSEEEEDGNLIVPEMPAQDAPAE